MEVSYIPIPLEDKLKKMAGISPRSFPKVFSIKEFGFNFTLTFQGDDKLIELIKHFREVTDNKCVASLYRIEGTFTHPYLKRTFEISDNTLYYQTECFMVDILEKIAEKADLAKERKRFEVYDLIGEFMRLK